MAVVPVDRGSRCCGNILTADARTQTEADYLLNTLVTDADNALDSQLGSNNAVALRKQQQLGNDSKLTNQLHILNGTFLFVEDCRLSSRREEIRLDVVW